MPGILSRYILRETILTWLAVTVVLLLILVVDQFARVLGDAAAAKLPKDAVLMVMGLSSVQYLTILIPVGMFLSVMLAMGRLYRDSEMAAIMASGIGPLALYRPLVTFALVLAALVGYLSLDVVPKARHQIQIISDEARQRMDLGLLEPGRFVSFGSEPTVMYAEKVSEDGRLSNVFVQRRRGNRVELILAEQAAQRNDETGAKVLTFYRGRRYEGIPGSREFRIISFAEHGIPYELADASPVRFAQESQPTIELLRSEDAAAAAELQWRISIPMTLLVLTILAVPLSHSSPREGRYNRVATGIMIYIIYSNLLGAAKVWLEQGESPRFIGIWWVHALFLLIAGVMLMRQYGVFARVKFVPQLRLAS